jgi:hypothetical protein
MITDPADLKPSTLWEETVWSRTPEEALVDHTFKARLCVATLLPFRDGKPDWEGFENSIRWMIACAEAAGVEIAFVLNADTGYIFNLSLDLYGEVIRRFRAAFPEPTIICGSTAVGASGDAFKPEWYRPHFEVAQAFDLRQRELAALKGSGKPRRSVTPSAPSTSRPPSKPKRP